MATVTNGTGENQVTGAGARSWMWIFKEFMKANTSWTIAGSGNGSTGGMGSDVVTVATQFDTTGTWFVLQSPDATLQILFQKSSSVVFRMSMWVNPFADYVGGGATTIPTSAGGHSNLFTDANVFQTSGDYRLHITADDSASGVPGWATIMHTVGVFTTNNGGFALVPMVNGDPNDTRPWAIYTVLPGGSWDQTTIYSTSVAAGATHGWATPPASAVATGVSGFAYIDSTLAWPRNMGVNSDSDEMTIPIVFGRRSALVPTYYKGVSSYMQWCSVQHDTCSTFASLTKIVAGDVAFPWDGVNTPSVS